MNWTLYKVFFILNFIAKYSSTHLPYKTLSLQVVPWYGLLIISKVKRRCYRMKLQTTITTLTVPSFLPTRQQPKHGKRVNLNLTSVQWRTGWRWLSLHELCIAGDIRIGAHASVLLLTHNRSLFCFFVHYF